MLRRNVAICRIISKMNEKILRYPYKIHGFQIESQGVRGFTIWKQDNNKPLDSFTILKTVDQLEDQDLGLDVKTLKKLEGQKELLIDFSLIASITTFTDFLKFLRQHRTTLLDSQQAEKLFKDNIKVEMIDPDSFSQLSYQEIDEFFSIMKMHDYIQLQVCNHIATTVMKQSIAENKNQVLRNNDIILKTIKAFGGIYLPKEHRTSLMEILGKLDATELSSSLSRFIQFVEVLSRLQLPRTNLPIELQSSLFDWVKYEKDLSSLTLEQRATLIRDFTTLGIHTFPDKTSDALFNGLLFQVFEDTTKQNPSICQELFQQFHLRGVTIEILSEEQIEKMFDLIESYARLGKDDTVSVFSSFSMIGCDYWYSSPWKNRLNQLMIEIGKSISFKSQLLSESLRRQLLAQLNSLVEACRNIGLGWKELPSELKSTILKPVLAKYTSDDDISKSVLVKSIRILVGIGVSWEDIPFEVQNKMLRSIPSFLNENFHSLSFLAVIQHGLKRMGFDYLDEMKLLIESLLVNVNTSSEGFVGKSRKIFCLLHLCNNLECDAQTRETLQEKISSHLDSVNFNNPCLIAKIAANTPITWNEFPLQYRIKFTQAILFYLGQSSAAIIAKGDFLQLCNDLVQINAPFDFSQIKYINIALKPVVNDESSFLSILEYFSRHVSWKQLTPKTRKTLISLFLKRFESKVERAVGDYARMASYFSIMTFDSLHEQNDSPNQIEIREEILGIHHKLLKAIFPFDRNGVEKNSIAIYFEYVRTLPFPWKQSLLTAIDRKELPFIATSRSKVIPKMVSNYIEIWPTVSEELQDHLTSAISKQLSYQHASLEILPFYEALPSRVLVPSVTIKCNGEIVAFVIRTKYTITKEGKASPRRKNLFFEHLYRCYFPRASLFRIESSNVVTTDSRAEIIQTIGENVLAIIQPLLNPSK